MRNPCTEMHLVLVSLFLGACAPATSFPPPAPTPARTWTVDLVQSGGFAGVNLLVRIDTAGVLTATDARAAREVTKTLSHPELIELDQLLEGAIQNEPTETHSACADCFMYDLQVTGPAASIRWRGDDTTLASSGLERLIAFLIELREKALAGAS